MNAYAALKFVHIVSSTLLFGTGLGTAFFMWMSHRSGNVPAIANAARLTVLADWLFTTPAADRPAPERRGIDVAGRLSTDNFLAAGVYALVRVRWSLLAAGGDIAAARTHAQRRRLAQRQQLAGRVLPLHALVVCARLARVFRRTLRILADDHEALALVSTYKT
jgi:uncharacterized membrane protein